MAQLTCSRKPFVVVVDSDGARRRSLVARLTDEGCYVASFVCGEDALTYAAENEPDAIVSDWRLSDMAGPEFTRKMKVQSFPSRVFLLNDQVDWRLLREALECGGEDFLSRPVSIEVLLRTLELPLKKRQAPSPAAC